MIVFRFLFTGLLLFAGPRPNPCGDFYTFACTHQQQGRPDGTGLVFTVAQRRQRVQESILSEKDRFALDFDQLMQQNSKLKNKILASFQCASGDPCERTSLDEVKNYIFLDVSRAYSITPSLAGVQAPLSTLQEATAHSELRNLVLQTAERVDERLISQERRNNVKDTLFPQVRAQMLALVETLPAGPQRARALARLREVNVDVRHCSVGRETIFASNAYYENKTVQVCMSLLMATDSIYALTSLIAHELAHSIDPITSDTGTASLFEPLTHCLSRHRSIGERPGSDPMSEAFCDWMGYEVVSRLVQQPGHVLNRNSNELSVGMANSHPFCSSATPQRLRTSDTHPPGRDRIEMIAAQPQLRQRLGCTNNSQLNYCPITGVPAELEAPPPLQDSGIAQ